MKQVARSAVRQTAQPPNAKGKTMRNLLCTMAAVFFAQLLFGNVEAPKSGVEEKDGIVTIGVFIDKTAEGLEDRIVRGSAILRARAYLEKHFPDLKKNVTVRTRIVRQGYDDEERVYSFVSEYRRSDVETAIAREQEREKAAFAAQEADRLRKEAEARERARREAERQRAQQELERKRMEAEKQIQLERETKERERRNRISAAAEKGERQERERRRRVEVAQKADFQDDMDDGSVVVEDTAKMLSGAADNAEGTVDDVDSGSLFK